MNVLRDVFSKMVGQRMADGADSVARCIAALCIGHSKEKQEKIIIDALAVVSREVPALVQHYIEHLEKNIEQAKKEEARGQ